MRQADLEEEIAHLEQQQTWLRETFRDVLHEEVRREKIFDLRSKVATKSTMCVADTMSSRGQDIRRLLPPPHCPYRPHLVYAPQSLHYDRAGLPSTAMTPLEVRGPHNSGGSTPMSSRYPVLQDGVVVRRGVTTTAGAQGTAGDVRGEETGAACALVVLRGHEKGGDTRGMVCAPLPTVLAVGYRSGLVDVAVLPGGIAPRWGGLCSPALGWHMLLSCRTRGGWRPFGVVYIGVVFCF